MSNKKGFELVFSWIFSLVAGVLIFSFLIYFAYQHTDLFGKRTNLLVREEFDNAFGSLKSTEISTLIELQENITLKFDCVDGRILFGVDEGDKREIPGKIIAAPSVLSGHNFSIKTESFVRPFKIVSFLYIDSDERKVRSTETDTLKKALDYSSNDVCIKQMIDERISLVKASYLEKISYLGIAKNSDGAQCNYGNIKSKIQILNVNNLDTYSDDINNLNEQLIWQGCPALF